MTIAIQASRPHGILGKGMACADHLTDFGKGDRPDCDTTAVSEGDAPSTDAPSAAMDASASVSPILKSPRGSKGARDAKRAQQGKRSSKGLMAEPSVPSEPPLPGDRPLEAEDAGTRAGREE